MSGWWFAAGCVGLFLLLWALMERRWRSEAAKLAASRPNLSEDEFLTAVADVSDPDIAQYLWEEIADHWSPATPHPNDDFLNRLSIDPDEPQDWLERFCQQRGYDWRAWPMWDEGRPTTVRSFAGWLAEGRRRAEASA
ncbi:hypothetical protein ASE06_00660 [Sphingopyxis sp. Root214]|uniref:hypothetical protein n=1 Tax=unclassified Sphingopyxis TaxID=2614943 RepID=UPI0006F21B5D|nr:MULTISPECIES: hypothetical protein [unclassified Sphingopyxis]KQZ69373.1 hypothetical protein ASD73_20335 [Sphingopyxis sp. Root154]KRC10775.1 hypothetical protein ASE06_00660 [Sphingopyxis sp. Root214]